MKINKDAMVIIAMATLGEWCLRKVWQWSILD